MKNKKLTVDIIIPVYKPDKKFSRLLNMLMNQSYPIGKIIVMNTEESYWNSMGYQKVTNLEAHHLTKDEFDHGDTRNRGADYSGADIIVFLTQDAVPKDEFLIAELVKPFLSYKNVAVSYGRQLPDSHCGFIEAYTRSFNYPDQSRLKTKDDLPQLGIKTFFASDVCAAYKLEIFKTLGGFTKKTIFNEDMIFSGRAIDKGFGIYYSANALVIHSHNYSNIMHLKRNFDLAVSQKDHPEIFNLVSSQSEGIKLVKQTAAYLINNGKIYLLPKLFLTSSFKYLGYLLGKQYKRLPKKIILALSMNPAYWNSSGH